MTYRTACMILVLPKRRLEAVTEGLEWPDQVSEEGEEEDRRTAAV